MSGYGYVTTWGDRDKEPRILTMFHRLMGVVIARKIIKLAACSSRKNRSPRKKLAALAAETWRKSMSQRAETSV